MGSVFDIVEPVSVLSLLNACFWLTAYMVYQFIGAKYMPSLRGHGFAIENGKRKDYKLTGLQMYALTIIGYNSANRYYGFSIQGLLRDFWSYFICVNVISLIISVWLYKKGRAAEGMKSSQGTKEKSIGLILFDFWCGVELNPALSGVDLKMFFYQPSLIGMNLFVLSFAEYQQALYGYLTPQMVLFQIFIALYLLSHYIKEEFMLSTWDIIAEHFGFMLVWGDLIYVPFWYSVVGWFLADNLTDYGVQSYLALAVFHLLGHTIFRVSNWQKYVYKRYGKDSSLFGVRTQLLEGKLLISGFWGIGRHLNYSGEILTYLSFAMCSGFSNLVPYLLPISLTILLSQRAWRDDKKCSEKYKELWKKYCGIAKFKMVPLLY